MLTDLFHLWNKWVTAGEIQAGECDLGGLQTASEWAGVIIFWHGDSFVCDPICPKKVVSLSLPKPFFGKTGISPFGRAVSIQLSPVALNPIFLVSNFRRPSSAEKAPLHSTPCLHKTRSRHYGSLLHGDLGRALCIARPSH